MRVSLREVEEELLEHSKRVKEEAERLRRERISYRVLIKDVKPRWELELLNRIRDLLGDVSLLGKDSGFVGDRGSEWVCVCDVFDGSLSFMSGLKYYAYSVALARRGELVYGLVVDLENMERYRAEKGKGAVIVSEGLERKLSEVALEVPANFDAIVTNVRLRGFSSVELRCSSLELCYLARGAAEVGVGRSWVPDIAGGYVVARESGIEFANWDFAPLGKLPIDYVEVRYVASTPKILAELKAKYGSIRNLLG